MSKSELVPAIARKMMRQNIDCVCIPPNDKELQFEALTVGTSVT